MAHHKKFLEALNAYKQPTFHLPTRLHASNVGLCHPYQGKRNAVPLQKLHCVSEELHTIQLQTIHQSVGMSIQACCKVRGIRDMVYGIRNTECGIRYLESTLLKGPTA